MGVFAKLGRGIQRLVGATPTVTDEARQKLAELRKFMDVLNNSGSAHTPQEVKGVFDFTWVTPLKEEDQRAFYQRWLTIERRMNEQLEQKRKVNATKARTAEQLKIEKQLEEESNLKLIQELQ